jgi:hypothetical protein
MSQHDGGYESREDRIVPANQYSFGGLLDETPGRLQDSRSPVSADTDLDTKPRAKHTFTQVHVQRPTRTLDEYDVASLIVNKMIGTGIFTAPPAVLLLTGSKREAIGLWVLGAFYTVIRYLNLRFNITKIENISDSPNQVCFCIWSMPGVCGTPEEN